MPPSGKAWIGNNSLDFVQLPLCYKDSLVQLDRRAEISRRQRRWGSPPCSARSTPTAEPCTGVGAGVGGTPGTGS
jgi:hypothetical protein